MNELRLFFFLLADYENGMNESLNTFSFIFVMNYNEWICEMWTLFSHAHTHTEVTKMCGWWWWWYVIRWLVSLMMMMMNWAFNRIKIKTLFSLFENKEACNHWNQKKSNFSNQIILSLLYCFFKKRSVFKSTCLMIK